MQAFSSSEVKFGYEKGTCVRLKFILSKLLAQKFNLHKELREKWFTNLRVMPKRLQYVNNDSYIVRTQNG